MDLSYHNHKLKLCLSLHSYGEQCPACSHKHVNFYYEANAMISTLIRTVLSASSHFILCLILVLLLLHQATAQSATDGATPLALTPGAPQGSYQLSGFENVNLFNGDLNFSLPLLNIGGRGEARVPMMLPIETRWRTYFYEYLTVTGQYANIEIATPNWWSSLRPGYGPGVLAGRLGQDSFTDCGEYYGGVQSCRYTLYRLTFTASDGTEYELRDQLTNGAVGDVGGNVCPPPNQRQARGSVFVTADGTSMTFISDTPLSDSNPPEKPDGYLLMPNGLRYRIDGGLVSWIRDRNGNRLSFAYDANSRVIMITDSLNRQVSITYDVQDGTYGGLYDKITFNGYNGAPRVIHISKTSLSNALRNTQPNDDTSVHTASQLFPGLSGSQVNPTVVSQVWLPDNRSYRFYYNPYVELSRVELPTGGALEYDWASGVTNNTSGVVLSNGKPPHAIYRRVIERRTYSNSGDLSTLASKATYSRPESLDGYGMPQTLGYVLVNHYNDSTLLSGDKHYFYGSPTQELSVLTSISYPSWKNAREYQSELIDNDGSTVLQRVVNNWQQPVSGSAWPLTQPETSDNVKSNNPHITSTITTLEPSLANQVAQQTFSYDQYNNQTDLYEYDYGAGGVGTLVRRAHTDYLTTNPVNGADYTSTNIHIRSLPTQQSIYDANNVERARTTYEYDNYASDSTHAPLIYRPGITGLDSAFNTSYGTRGNVTRVSRWLLSNGTSINTYAQYDIAGNSVKSIDGRGLVSLVDYSSTYQYAYPTHTTSPTPDVGNNFCSTTPLETTTAYDLSTGLVTSSTDPNGQTTTVQYNDVLDRPTAVLQPDGGRTTYTYVDVHQCGPYVETRTLLDTSGRETDDYVFFDGLGRSVRAFKYDGQDSNNPYLTSDTQYDALGRVRRVSNPYRSSGCTSTVNPSGNWTTTAYDALGRVLSVTTPDSAQAITTYSGNQVTVQDQKGKTRRSVTDALGRLTQMIEDPAGLAYQTSYTYDVLGNLSTVTQNTQHRYFMYDSLSHLIRAKNPEQDANASLALFDPISGNSQWSIGYSYDANGNLSTRTDARGVVSSYIYDNLNRSITINYSDGTHIDRIYDSATNGRGRLRGSFQYPNTGAYAHTAIDTYDAMGRPRYQRQHFYANGGWGTAYVTQRNYDYAGHVTLQTYPSGRVVNYSYDQTGRTSAFTGNLGDGVTRTYTTSITYDEWNGLSREQFGTDTPLYHKEKRNIRGQLYDMRLSTVNDSDNWNRGAIVNYYSFQPYGWGTSGPDNNGNLLVQQHWVPTDDAISNYTLMQQNYDYDALNRLKWMGEYQNAATNTAGQDYSYDRFGNRTMTGWGTGTSNQQFSVDTNTNRLGVPSGQYGVMQYDAAGNLTNDTYSGAGTRTYDAENQMVSATNYGNQQSVYTYDADGRRVRRNSYGQETWQAYGMDGELEAEYAAGASPSSPQKEYGYRNGQLLITASGQSCGVGYQGTKSWAATSPSLGHVVGHQEGSDWVANVSTDSANFMVYGPYDNTFGQGHHTAKFLLQVDNTNGSDVVATIDVVTGYGSNYLAQRQIRRNEFTAANQWQWFTLEFDNPCFGVLEARVWWNHAVNMRFSQSTITGVNSVGGTIEWVVPDQLGTPRMIADKTGSLAGIKRHDYLPFGEELFAGTGNRTAQNGYAGDDVRQKFTQKERDVETGLDYFGARYYSSVQGRFTSVDPGNHQALHDLSDPQSWNAYAYVNNNPLCRVDHDGKGWLSDLWQRFRNGLRYKYWETDAELQKRVDTDRAFLKEQEKNANGALYWRSSLDEPWRRLDIDALDTGEVLFYARSLRQSAINELSQDQEREAMDLPPIGGNFIPVPQTPKGTSIRQFGRDIMKWGTGDAEARARAVTLTREELERAGVTREIAEAWRDFYKDVVTKTPQNPSAAGRADLMQRALELLGGK
jgi:RHS repeat-associated protein